MLLILFLMFALYCKEKLIGCYNWSCHSLYNIAWDFILYLCHVLPGVPPLLSIPVSDYKQQVRNLLSKLSNSYHLKLLAINERNCVSPNIDDGSGSIWIFLVKSFGFCCQLGVACASSEDIAIILKLYWRNGAYWKLLYPRFTAWESSFWQNRVKLLLIHLAHICRIVQTEEATTVFFLNKNNA